MPTPEIVTRESWLKARRDLLDREKELTRLRDQVTRERQELPWVKVEKNYSFNSIDGTRSLAQLFGNQSQLIVQHFMFGENWDEGCPMCSFWADNHDAMMVHLSQRDVSLVAVSRGPIEKLLAYKQRMGWQFEWVSSSDSTFNFDFQVSFTPDILESGQASYNYRPFAGQMEEMPGFSVFLKDEDGTVYHTYSLFSRGLDALNPAYQFLDLLPRGRNEGELPYPMSWVRRHDSYQ